MIKRSSAFIKNKDSLPMKVYSIIIIFLISFSILDAQSYEHKDKIYDEYIKTSTVEVNNLPTNFPVLSLNSSQFVMLKFDDLLNEERTLYYRIIHCDKDWAPSKLREIEYISGFNDERLRNYSYSINTRVPYMHYWQQFPNKDTHFKVSGNYLIVIYEDKIDYPLLSRRFIISENKVLVDMYIIFPGDVENIRFKQELQVNINFEKFKMRNPIDEISLVMLQNDNWYNKQESKPSFFSGTNLKFNRLRTFDFWGLTEFREFDTRTVMRLGRHVQFIERNKFDTDVLLMKDEARRNKVYLANFDFNGKFIIENFERLSSTTANDVLDNYVTNTGNNDGLRESLRDSLVNSITTRNPLIDNDYIAEERNIRSDYTKVIFSLQDDYLDGTENVYIFGAMNNWLPSEEYRMKFDNRGLYTAEILMKQGYYNYMYGIVDENGNVNYRTMEGSWSDTENEYQSIVYFRGLGDIYDRIIGFNSFNTLTQPFPR